MNILENIMNKIHKKALYMHVVGHLLIKISKSTLYKRNDNSIEGSIRDGIKIGFPIKNTT